MRTVAVLIAAAALLSDKTNWTEGSLTGLFRDKDYVPQKPCFCALGAIAKEGGALVENETVAYGNRYKYAITRDGARLDSCKGLVAVDGEAVEKLSRAKLKELAKVNFHPVATVKAQQYLLQAARDLFGDIPDLNDVSRRTFKGETVTLGYEGVMKAFDLAIRRAKRRHINGDKGRTRKPKAVQAPVAQEVSL
jgi:hypothetical protein